MIDTSAYEASHGRRPYGSNFDLWIFENKRTGRQIERTGTWSVVKADLSFGLSNLSDWVLLP
jgi:hypothetical protein